MLNVLEAISARRSTPRLNCPGPTQDELRQLFHAASSAPDHGRCRPWRFIVVPERRADDFGKILEAAYVRRCQQAGEPADPQQRQRERTRLMRAPTFIVVACQPKLELRIPIHEQLAAVAAATQNLLLSATALGYGSMWATGAAATDPMVKEALQLSASDSIVGFIYLGTIPGSRTSRQQDRNVDLSGVVRHWKLNGASNALVESRDMLVQLDQVPQPF